MPDFLRDPGFWEELLQWGLIAYLLGATYKRQWRNRKEPLDLRPLTEQERYSRAFRQ